MHLRSTAMDRPPRDELTEVMTETPENTKTILVLGGTGKTGRRVAAATTGVWGTE